MRTCVCMWVRTCVQFIPSAFIFYSVFFHSFFRLFVCRLQIGHLYGLNLILHTIDHMVKKWVYTLFVVGSSQICKKKQFFYLSFFFVRSDAWSHIYLLQMFIFYLITPFMTRLHTQHVYGFSVYSRLDGAVVFLIFCIPFHVQMNVSPKSHKNSQHAI